LWGGAIFRKRSDTENREGVKLLKRDESIFRTRVGNSLPTNQRSGRERLSTSPQGGGYPVLDFRFSPAEADRSEPDEVASAEAVS
jgi:hypothetical protein